MHLFYQVNWNPAVRPSIVLHSCPQNKYLPSHWLCKSVHHSRLTHRSRNQHCLRKPQTTLHSLGLWVPAWSCGHSSHRTSSFKASRTLELQLLPELHPCTHQPNSYRLSCALVRNQPAMSEGLRRSVHCFKNSFSHSSMWQRYEWDQEDNVSVMQDEEGQDSGSRVIKDLRLLGTFIPEAT